MGLYGTNLKTQKYKKIIILYDADETGYYYSIKHADSIKCEYRLLEKYLIFRPI